MAGVEYKLEKGLIGQPETYEPSRRNACKEPSRQPMTISLAPSLSMSAAVALLISLSHTFIGKPNIRVLSTYTCTYSNADEPSS